MDTSMYLQMLPWKKAPFEDAASELVTRAEAQLEHLEMNNPKIKVEEFKEAFSAMASSSEAPAHPAPASSNTPIFHEPQHDANLFSGFCGFSSPVPI